MLATDTIADVVVGNAGAEDRVADSHYSMADGAVDEEDGTSHAAFVHCVVVLPVCSSRLGAVPARCPQRADCLTNTILPWSPNFYYKVKIYSQSSCQRRFRIRGEVYIPRAVGRKVNLNNDSPPQISQGKSSLYSG